MKYVKLTAKPNTWFKEGTEVYHYDAEPLRRITLDEWNECVNFEGIKGILCCGTRISQFPLEIEQWGKGNERLDGEYCSIDEFNVEITEAKF